MGFFSGIFGSKKEPEPTPPQSLSSILTTEDTIDKPLLFRPSSSTQKTLMIEAAIRARRDVWAKGGYILTGSQDAADVIRVLKENAIAYSVFSMATTREHNILSSLTAVLDDEIVRVYIDDESAPLGRRNDDYKRFLANIIEQCRKWNEGASYEGWRYLPVFYIDLPFANTPGYAVRMWRERQRIGSFVLMSKSIHDREIAALGTAYSDSEELYSCVANSISIFGSGKRHHAEILADFELRNQGSPSDDEIRQESSLGIYLPDLKIIDLST
ncbi:hypothetical protein [Pseudomonas putida]|uniref:Uncharacterized protein n=1 Tax=Pseudomonas putida TaxID=303 RepID=A0A8I1JKB6_PSEPU|nr:hypothetical protein [Pseudomonas putida]MBI6883285.1 hypothetical protein [Pseudomonas putida]